MADLHKGARPDEIFHLSPHEPIPTVTQHWWGRRTVWTRPEDGTIFTSRVWLNHLQHYTGTCKVDGSRTYAYRSGQLGEPFDTEQFVYTTTPSEMTAFRWRKDGVGQRLHWDSMGSY